MYQIKTLKICNLFTYVGETVVNIDNGSTYMIYGENNDDDGYESNGSGKSSLLETICIAISGESYREVNKEDFINDDQKSASTSILLHNKIHNRTLAIERDFQRNKSAVVRLFVNGLLRSDLPNTVDVNREIFELLGISKEDFFNYYIVGEFAGKPFLIATDNETGQKYKSNGTEWVLIQ